MPFKKTFEKHVNKNLHDEEDRGQPSDVEDMDIKTQPALKVREEEAEDYEVHDKKDHPPRFSTLYGPASRMPRSPSPQRQCYAAPPPPAPRRKSGIWMPWSLFILLAVMLFLESTVLFTYTVIGLYNNTPSRVFAWAGTGNNVPAGYCEMQKEVAPQPAAVNFAPNFVMPPAAPPAVQAAPVTVTVTPEHDYLSALISKMMSTTTTASPTTTTTSTSTTSTSSVDTSSAAAALASEIASMLATARSTTTPGGGVLTLTTNIAPVVTKTETIPPSSESTSTSAASATADPSGKPASTALSSLPFLPSVVA